MRTFVTDTDGAGYIGPVGGGNKHKLAKTYEKWLFYRSVAKKQTARISIIVVTPIQPSKDISG